MSGPTERIPRPGWAETDNARRYAEFARGDAGERKRILDAAVARMKPGHRDVSRWVIFAATKAAAV